MRRSTPLVAANWQTPLLCILLVAVTLAVYWPVRLNDFVNYDDLEYIKGNPHIQKGITWPTVCWAFSTRYASNWHPLTWLSHALDLQWLGARASGHHMVSLAFHAANAGLLFIMLAQWTRARWRSLLVAALFALHPLHVESVVWASERKDVLSAFFALLALLAYGRFAKRSQSDLELRPWRSFSYVASLLLFAMALMSKPMLVTLPFVMFLLDLWPLRRISKENIRSTAVPLILEKCPFAILSAASCVVTVFAQQKAMLFHRDLALGARTSNAIVSIIRYVAQALWPHDLAVLYPHPMHWPLWQVLGAAILVTVISVFALRTLWRRPYIAVGWFWFLGMLVPVLGLVQVGVQAMADRYTYLPLTGLFIAVVWHVGNSLPSADAAPNSLRGLRILAGCVAAMLLAACAVATRHQIGIWHDTKTLFTHAIKVTKGNWVAHHNLALFALGRYQDEQHSSLTSQRLSFGNSSSETSANANASESAQAPVASSPLDLLNEIVAECDAALEIRSRYPEAHVTLAKALTELGKLDDARVHLESAVRLDPKNSEAHQNLAEILHRMGRVKEAAQAYQDALDLKPDWESVLNNLAWLLATHPDPEIRDGKKAVRLAERACDLTGRTNLWLLHTLAAAYAESAAFSNAVATAEDAQRLAVASGQPELIQTATNRLQLYRSGRPLRSP